MINPRLNLIAIYGGAASNALAFVDDALTQGNAGALPLNKGRTQQQRVRVQIGPFGPFGPFGQG